MLQTDIYPWQQQQWQQCLHSHRLQRLPHALLLYGQPGLGKQQFARNLAKMLLCEQPLPEGSACLECPSCHQYASGNHSDFRCIERLEDSQQLKIDQIRELNQFMVLSRQRSNYKIALVLHAETMNRNAANSLLKTLEEPGSGALIILVSSRLARLPATIRSRCQKLRFNIPATPVAEEWLASCTQHEKSAEILTMLRGEPLTALDFIQRNLNDQRREFFKALIDLLNNKLSAIEIAAQWRSKDLSLLQEWLLSWLMDVIRIRSRIQPEGLENTGLYRSLNAFSTRVELTSLFELYDKLLNIRRMSRIALNEQLLLEEALLGWRALLQKPAK